MWLLADVEAIKSKHKPASWRIRQIHEHINEMWQGELQLGSGEDGGPPGQLQWRIGITRVWRLWGHSLLEFRERDRARRTVPRERWEVWVTVTVMSQNSSVKPKECLWWMAHINGQKKWKWQKIPWWIRKGSFFYYAFLKADIPNSCTIMGKHLLAQELVWYYYSVSYQNLIGCLGK